MLKVENFTHGACERLLRQGYTHFVIKYRVDKEEIGAHCNVITFEAIRGSKVKAAIPISQVMDLPDGTATKYYVMHTTDEPEQ